MDLKFDTCNDNLTRARKLYSQFSKCQVKKSQEINDQQKLRFMIEKEREEILEIEKELRHCKKEYNRIVQNIGQAHKEAILHQINDKQIQNEINKRNYLVMTRAKQVLADEIKKHQKLEIEKNQTKQDILKKRKELYGKSSEALRKEAEQKYKQKLAEWTKLENILNQKLKNIRQRNSDSNKNIESPSVQSASKKQVMKEARLKNVQIQTESLVKDKENTKDCLTIEMKNVIACKVLESLNQLISSQKGQDKLFCDMAVNTSLSPDSYNLMSETSYLSFASDIECKTLIDQKSYDKSDEKCYNFKDLDLRELIERIKRIRCLIQNQQKVTECKVLLSTVSKDDFPITYKPDDLSSEITLSSIPDFSEISCLSFESKSPTVSLIDQNISFSNSSQSSIDFSQLNQDFSIDKEKFVNSILKLTECKEAKKDEIFNNSKSFLEHKICQSTPKKVT